MGTTVTAMLFRLRESQLRRISEGYSNRKRVWDAGFLVPVLARFADGNPDRSADLVLKELRAADRYLLCPNGLSLALGDRVIRGVLAPAVDAGGPNAVAAREIGRAPDGGSRLPLAGANACPQVSGDIQVPRKRPPARPARRPARRA